MISTAKKEKWYQAQRIYFQEIPQGSGYHDKEIMSEAYITPYKLQKQSFTNTLKNKNSHEIYLHKYSPLYIKQNHTMKSNAKTHTATLYTKKELKTNFIHDPNALCNIV